MTHHFETNEIVFYRGPRASSGVPYLSNLGGRVKGRATLAEQQIAARHTNLRDITASIKGCFGAAPGVDLV